LLDWGRIGREIRGASFETQSKAALRPDSTLIAGPKGHSPFGNTGYGLN
jgi:hypothetical protein